MRLFQKRLKLNELMHTLTVADCCLRNFSLKHLHLQVNGFIAGFIVYTPKDLYIQLLTSVM